MSNGQWAMGDGRWEMGDGPGRGRNRGQRRGVLRTSLSCRRKTVEVSRESFSRGRDVIQVAGEEVGGWRKCVPSHGGHVHAHTMPRGIAMTFVPMIPVDMVAF